MLKKIFYFLSLFLFSFSLHAEPIPLMNQVHEVKLQNGMTFLLVRRTGAPVFSGAIYVRVGGIDEQEGQTGIAHMLEHMAFKGTSQIGTSNYPEEKKVLDRLEEFHAKILSEKNIATRAALHLQFAESLKQASAFVVPEEFTEIYQRNGGSDLNASTSQDLTNYFVTLPSNKLELWAAMESSRFLDPVFREFYAERDVVQEERRMRVDDSPGGKLYESFLQMAFDKSPYRRPTIGYPSDLQKLSATDLKKFYQKYYVPSNMVGVIVGDINIQETEKILRQYFDKIPAGEKPSNPNVVEPEPTQEKKIELSLQASPLLISGYLKPSLPHPDDYAFDVLSQILCEDRSSVFYQTLVVEKHLLQGVDCSTSTPGSRLPSLFAIDGALFQGVDSNLVLKSIDEVLTKAAQEGFKPEEIEKAKKNLKASFYFSIQDNLQLAKTLGYFQSIASDWTYVFKHPDQIDKIQSGDLQRIVQTYLKPERRRTAILQPKP